MKNLKRGREESPRVIPVLDEAIRLEYERMQELFSKFNQEGEIPVIITAGPHDYFTLYRIKTPFEITTPQHPVHTYSPFSFDRDSKSKPVCPFEKAWLVAELADERHVQIHPYKKGRRLWPREGGNFQTVGKYLPIIHHQETRECWVNYLIAGRKNVINQLDVWGFGIRRPVKYIKELLG